MIYRLIGSALMALLAVMFAMALHVPFWINAGVDGYTFGIVAFFGAFCLSAPLGPRDGEG